MEVARNAMRERKIIHITGKRQVTIPLSYYEKLNFGKEVECCLTDNAIVLRPLSASDDGFSMEILRDLMAEGYSGDALLTQFAQRRAGIAKTIGALLTEADAIAAGERESVTTKDIFGED